MQLLPQQTSIAVPWAARDLALTPYPNEVVRHSFPASEALGRVENGRLSEFSGREVDARTRPPLVESPERRFHFDPSLVFE